MINLQLNKEETMILTTAISRAIEVEENIKIKIVYMTI